MKKLLTLLFTVALALSLSAVTFAHGTGSAQTAETKKEEKAEKKAAKKKAKAEKKAAKNEQRERNGRSRQHTGLSSAPQAGRGLVNRIPKRSPHQSSVSSRQSSVRSRRSAVLFT